MGQEYLPGEAVEAFYFAAYDSVLFGVYHLPVPVAARDCAVVLCPPFEQEYIRCHRAYRQIAVRLARAGFGVLRFDYSGTGDSAGDEAVEGLAVWLTNAAAAIDEAKRRSGLSSVYLVGLRLGAAVAALAAAERADVAGLALWEPVVSGRDYVDELADWHQEKLRYFLAAVKTDIDRQAPGELLGMPLSPAMLDDLNRLDLMVLGHQPADRALVIESEAQEHTRKFAEQLSRLGTGVDYRQAEGPRVWMDDPDKALVPHQIVQAVVSWISEAGL